jgi:penicillin-binding protein 1C
MGRVWLLGSKARPSFLKKRSKKLLSRCRAPTRKSFLVLFFKKELLALPVLLFTFQVISRSHLNLLAPTPILYDRHGDFLAQFGNPDYGYWALPAVPDRVAAATLALEDRRFADHPGVDARAVVRAIWQHVHGGRSGASTIAMQVARMQHPEARTLWNKAVEAGTALVLTARYGRAAVLAQYLRLVPYANGSHGIAHAARWYLGKPVADLSWAEIAFLSAIPHAPAALNPLHRAGLYLCRQRAGRILDTLAAQHVIAADQMAAARAQLAALQISAPPPRPAVALLAILRLRRMIPHPAPDATDPRIRTTLDLGLQTAVADLSRSRLNVWRNEGAQQVAVMVVRRHSRDVLASIGSAGFDTLPAGRIDFSSALRSPGSTLKPFVYALALERGTLSPAEVLQDLPDTSAGIGNADGAYLGPLLPRQALANSRNVPAVALLREVGLQRTFEQLRALGLHDLDGTADRFGLSMAIGSLPTSLDRLMRAYATLAEDGQDAPLRWLRDQPQGLPQTLVTRDVARRIGRYLSDPVARLPSFQRYGSVEYPFAVALKTGTSQGYRDAWVLAWSQLYVVGVWVGRADAGPMSRLSGAVSAADLAQAVLLRLHGVTRGDLTADDFAAPSGDVDVELCTATGQQAHAGCASRLAETLPAGLRQPVRVPDGGAELAILSPAPKTRVWLNPEVPAGMNRLTLRASAGPGIHQIVWRIDGADFATADPAIPLSWPASPGMHTFQVRLPLQPGASAVVHVLVN